MKKKNLFALGITAVFLLTGCQSASDRAETEALKEQIARLEQQVSTLEQQNAQATNSQADAATQNQDDSVTSAIVQPPTGAAADAALQSPDEAAVNDMAQNQTKTRADDMAQSPNGTAEDNTAQNPNNAAADDTAQNPNNAAADDTAQNPDNAAADDMAAGTAAQNLATTYTMEELSAMVDAFAVKSQSATASGTSSENMEQFFVLKQEEKQIDDCLDRHEDELEYLYHNGSLTRDDYKKLERELERLDTNCRILHPLSRLYSSHRPHSTRKACVSPRPPFQADARFPYVCTR